MKIHIVQKGDTFWEISKAYGVDFEELKELNPQISSPDMLMPGMKIKIPSSTKPVKKETVSIKETKKQTVKEKPKNESKKIAPKPLPTIEEDILETPKEIKTKTPINHPPQPSLKQEKKAQEPKQPIQKMTELPLMTEEVTPSPPIKPQQHQAVEPQSLQEPMIYHSSHPCCHPIHYHCYPFMGQMLPEQHMQQGHHPMYQQVGQQYPGHPHQQHCECQQQMMPVHPQHVSRQMPEPFPLPNYDQLSKQMHTEQIQPQSNVYEPLAYPSFPEQHITQQMGNPFPMPPGYPVDSEINHQPENPATTGELQTNEWDDKQVDD